MRVRRYASIPLALWLCAAAPATSGPFILPTGVTADARGNVYVADAAAQQIDRVGPDGTIRVVAGTHERGADGLFAYGGFADGAAADARFFGPSGVAIGPDGAVYVADTYNHCIRRIAGGRVSTYAGACTILGNVDGARAAARFRFPRSLAFDDAGTLYVADFDAGIRRVDREGTVATLDVPVVARRATSVGAVTNSGQTTVFASDDAHVVAKNLATGETRSYGTIPLGLAGVRDVVPEAGRELGHVTALVALGPDAFAYVDAQDGAVKMLANGALGNLSTRAFAAPSGIARDGSRLVVAESAAQRIAYVPTPDIRGPVVGSPPQRAGRAFRVALVGNSFTFYDTLWSDSIAGCLERELAASVPTEVLAIRLGPFAGLADYVREYLSDGQVDAVVLQLNPAFVYLDSTDAPWNTDLSLSAKAWQPAFSATLDSILASLATRRVPTFVVAHPMPYQSGPYEQLAYRLGQDAGVTDQNDAASYGAFVAAVRASRPAHFIDTMPAILRNERSAGREALFNATDFHFSPAGRKLVCSSIARALRSSSYPR